MHVKRNQIAVTIRSSLLLPFFGILATLGLYLFLAADALAAAKDNDGARVGKNLGNLIGSIGSAVLLSLAGMMAIGILISRKFNLIGTLLVMVFLIGGLFVAPGSIWDMIEGFWNQVARGV